MYSCTGSNSGNSRISCTTYCSTHISVYSGMRLRCHDRRLVLASLMPAPSCVMRAIQRNHGSFQARAAQYSCRVYVPSRSSVPAVTRALHWSCTTKLNPRGSREPVAQPILLALKVNACALLKPVAASLGRARRACAKGGDKDRAQARLDGHARVGDVAAEDERRACLARTHARYRL